MVSCLDSAKFFRMKFCSTMVGLAILDQSVFMVVFLLRQQQNTKRQSKMKLNVNRNSRRSSCSWTSENINKHVLFSPSFLCFLSCYIHPTLCWIRIDRFDCSSFLFIFEYHTIYSYWKLKTYYPTSTHNCAHKDNCVWDRYLVFFWFVQINQTVLGPII